MADPKENKADVLVIGAGISGIAAAKCYLDLHPGCEMIILDRDTCVGGTWNARRSYDSFWTQWTVGAAEYSDLPMPAPPSEDTYYDLFKAKHTTKYLENYIDHHIYNGKSIRDRIHFSIDVQDVVQIHDGWSILASNRLDLTQKHTFSTTKLIVASGMTSIPNMPVLPGQDTFEGPILHQESFGSSKILSDPEIKHITVLGGGKSSADMVYEAVQAGKTVSWILKETETTGPGFFLSPKGMWHYRNAFEVAMTRMAAAFVPGIGKAYSWVTWLLYSTRVGSRLMQRFWNGIDKEMRDEGDFRNRKCLQGFEKLEPQGSIFWENGTGGFLNHADFFSTVADNVRIYTGTITHLTSHTIHLSSSSSLPPSTDSSTPIPITVPTDALLCGTGWLSSLTFLSPTLSARLGLPFPKTQRTPTDLSHWDNLHETADAQILQKFPSFAAPPPHYAKPCPDTQFRLYKNIAPLSGSVVSAEHSGGGGGGGGGGSPDRSIVFIGLVGVGNYFPVVEAQALWAMGYLDGHVKLPCREEQEREVALFNAWNRRRYLSNGNEGNNMTFELLGYCDGLLGELGLRSHRKGWWRDFWEPLVMADYRGLRGEYSARFGMGVEGAFE